MLNDKIRREFNRTESSIWAYQWLIIFVVLYTPEYILSVLTDKIYMGILIYTLRLLFNFTLIKAIYYSRYNFKLEEEYQWGNTDFVIFEEECLDKLYEKERLSYEDYEEYLEENCREISEEDIYDYCLYKQKGIISSRCFIILNIICYCLGFKVLVSGILCLLVCRVLPYDKIINVENSKIYKRGIIYWESEESGI